jgi:hypothetical protein
LLPVVETHDHGLRGVGVPVPEPEMLVETAGSPRFLGNPCVPLPCSQTPVGPRTPGHTAPRRGPRICQRRRLLTSNRSRGSIARPWDWLSTLRSGGCPTPRKTRFRLLGQAWPGGILLPAGLLRKVSEFESRPPSPSFPGAMTIRYRMQPGGRQGSHVSPEGSVRSLHASRFHENGWMVA